MEYKGWILTTTDEWRWTMKKEMKRVYKTKEYILNLKFHISKKCSIGYGMNVKRHHHHHHHQPKPKKNLQFRPIEVDRYHQPSIRNGQIFLEYIYCANRFIEVHERSKAIESTKPFSWYIKIKMKEESLQFGTIFICLILYDPIMVSSLYGKCPQLLCTLQIDASFGLCRVLQRQNFRLLQWTKLLALLYTTQKEVKEEVKEGTFAGRMNVRWKQFIFQCKWMIPSINTFNFISLLFVIIIILLTLPIATTDRNEIFNNLSHNRSIWLNGSPMVKLCKQSGRQADMCVCVWCM